MERHLRITPGCPFNPYRKQIIHTQTNTHTRHRQEGRQESDQIDPKVLAMFVSMNGNWRPNLHGLELHKLWRKIPKRRPLFRIRGGEQTLGTLILIDTEPSLPHLHIFSPDFRFTKQNPTSREDSGFPAERGAGAVEACRVHSQLSCRRSLLREPEIHSRLPKELARGQQNASSPVT